MIESGIDPSRVTTIYNFVDLNRFAPRDPLPSKPRNALIFNSRATEANFGALVREACRRCGIEEVDLVGYGSDRPVREPEALFAKYDLVFARARTALEAMAVGCAVIVSDPTGMAGLVTAKNFDALRRLNFGVRALRTPVSVDALANEIDAIDAGDVARVSARVRAEADMQTAVAAYEVIYVECGGHAAAVDDREALADYLRWLSLQTKLPGFVEWNTLKERHDALALESALRSSARDLRVAQDETTEAERRMRADIAALRKRVARMQHGPMSLLFRWISRRRR